MTLFPFFIFVNVIGVFSSSSMDNSSLMMDKLFESPFNDTKTEEDSTENSEDSSEIEESCFLEFYDRLSLTMF